MDQLSASLTCLKEVFSARPQGLEPFAARLAVIKELTGIGRHRLDGLMAAFRASQGGLKLHSDSCCEPSMPQERGAI